MKLNKFKNILDYSLTIYAIILWLLISSCNVTKNLPNGTVLYKGAVIKVLGDSTSKQELKKIQENLDELARPQPNSNFFILGFPYKVAINNLIGPTTKSKGIKNFIKKRFTEKPVAVNASIIEQNSTNFKNYLETQGYFHSNVTGELLSKKKQGKAYYQVHVAHRYYLHEISHNVDSLNSNFPELKDNFRDSERNLTLKPEQPFVFENIKAERNRINRELRNNGYYFFRPEYIEIQADSTVGNHQIDIDLMLKDKLPIQAQKQYLINDIFVYTAKNVGVFEKDSIDYDADFFRGLLLADSSKSYRQRIFTDAIGFRPGNFYSNDKQDISMQRLINLNNFQSVKNRFEVVNRLDSTLINAYYYLIPYKKKSFKSELNGISRSSGFVGTQLSLSWQNRNTFKAAENLQITANVSTELQVGGKTETQKLYRDNYRFGFSGKLNFPRFVAPFFHVDPEISKILPNTTLEVSSDTYIQKGLYNLNSLNASWGYVWRQGVTHEHRLTPFSLSLVRSSNISEEFISEIFNDPRLLTILDNQFIPGGSYNYSYTPVSKAKTTHYTFTGNLDLAGNIIGLLNKLKKDSLKRELLFGEVYAQFARIDGDNRLYFDLNPNLTWANRLFVGIGIPYGNSNSLPFTRQYFSGGSNSIRAFQARGVGPGSYQRQDNITELFLGNFTGDIKLEMNTELRWKLNSFLGTALFVDAGNVWMYRDAGIYQDESVLFNKNFYKELAIGAGVGLRFDFSFFIFRLDLATPLRKPSLPEGERWVINAIQFGNKDWRKQNLILNIAVGYPF